MNQDLEFRPRHPLSPEKDAPGIQREEDGKTGTLGYFFNGFRRHMERISGSAGDMKDNARRFR
jgi:hypothetical protein